MSYKYNYFFQSLHLQIRLENNIIKKFVKKFAGSKKIVPLHSQRGTFVQAE